MHVWIRDAVLWREAAHACGCSRDEPSPLARKYIALASRDLNPSTVPELDCNCHQISSRSLSHIPGRHAALTTDARAGTTGSEEVHLLMSCHCGGAHSHSPVGDDRGGSLGSANAQPVCSSSLPGLVRCHVGCTTDTSMASSSPCIPQHYQCVHHMVQLQYASFLAVCWRLWQHTLMASRRVSTSGKTPGNDNGDTVAGSSGTQPWLRGGPSTQTVHLQ